LEKYVHNDYIHTDVRGEILTRTAWLSYVKDRKDKGVSNPNVEFEDIHISIYEDFAFVTGINAFSGQAYTSNDKSSDKPRKLRFTQVLKKENDIWKRILFQGTYIESH
jgi:ketosteroid isomerase-like protein